jgi:phosphopantothenoylcysteine decarboxylase/phosphopantothenate--cysteine ligase
MFDLSSEFAVEHVSLAERADIIVVAPATANVIAKIALGLSDDHLTGTILASRAPVLVAPAMDAHMYANPATQDNLAILKERGVIILGPSEGRLASGLVGVGRLVETHQLVGKIKSVLGRDGDFKGRRVIVSAGGTSESIDPVREITNRSSGKMGYALAEAARDRGADTVLVTASKQLVDPVDVEIVRVQTSSEMLEAVKKNVSNETDALIMAAAVSDYKPKTVSVNKVKKDKAGWEIGLESTIDILETIEMDAGVKVGFAAESTSIIQNAILKVSQKKLDLIVANDISSPQSGFGSDTNKVWIIDRGEKVEELPVLPKYEVANRILDRTAQLFK